MRELNQQQLGVLYINYRVWLHDFCDGHAKMSVSDFYDKYGLEPCSQ